MNKISGSETTSNKKKKGKNRKDSVVCKRLREGVGGDECRRWICMGLGFFSIKKMKKKKAVPEMVRHAKAPVRQRSRGNHGGGSRKLFQTGLQHHKTPMNAAKDRKGTRENKPERACVHSLRKWGSKGTICLMKRNCEGTHSSLKLLPRLWK